MHSVRAGPDRAISAFLLLPALLGFCSPVASRPDFTASDSSCVGKDYSIFSDPLPPVLTTARWNVSIGEVEWFVSPWRSYADAGVGTSYYRLVDHPRYALAEYFDLDVRGSVGRNYNMLDSSLLETRIDPNVWFDGRYYFSRLPFIGAEVNANVSFDYASADGLVIGSWYADHSSITGLIGLGRMREVGNWVIAKALEKYLLSRGALNRKLTPEGLASLMTCLGSRNDTRQKVEFVNSHLTGAQAQLSLEQGFDVAELIDRSMYPYVVGSEGGLELRKVFTVSRNVFSADSAPVVGAWFRFNRPINETRLFESKAEFLLSTSGWSGEAFAGFRHFASMHNLHAVGNYITFSSWSLGATFGAESESAGIGYYGHVSADVQLLKLNRSRLEAETDIGTSLKTQPLRLSPYHSFSLHYYFDLL